MTARDKQNRALALDLIKTSNATVTSFAKQMVTTALSAVGVILAIAKFRGFGGSSVWVRVALAAMCGLCLAAALVFAMALRARQIAVSLDDYGDAPGQLVELAHRRERITICGLGLFASGIVGAILLLTLF